MLYGFPSPVIVGTFNTPSTEDHTDQTQQPSPADSQVLSTEKIYEALAVGSEWRLLGDDEDFSFIADFETPDWINFEKENGLSGFRGTPTQTGRLELKVFWPPEEEALEGQVDEVDVIDVYQPSADDVNITILSYFVGRSFTHFLYHPTLYVTWFPSEKLAVGPEFRFGCLWGTATSTTYSNGSITSYEEWDESVTSLYFGGRGALFPQGHAVSGPYLLGQAGLGTVSYDSEDSEDISGSETDFSAGAGLGYQWRLGPACTRACG